ncbi:glycosyltransferase 87 family protein [Microbacterium sp. G2-8]|uniref:glycosyltransferase 87 family protein n=1 Tax=Microbacterium sp. G2-8 TaxID=2842454 RepID=UPI0027E226AA|nr:glycosyltransferase 87 family protein [Microbacterium sp. G2-8]
MRQAPLVAVWIGFLAAHAISTWLGWVWPNGPMGDTYLVYEPWSDRAIDGQGIVGISESWVYPPLALVPMVVAQALVWFSSYSLSWAVLVGLVDIVAFGILVGRGSSRGRLAGGWLWAGFVLVLGPVALFRLDAVTVPLAILALLLIGAHPRTAGALIACATWIKVWPAALAVSVVIASRQRWRVVRGGVAVSILVVTGVVLAGGSEHLLGFVTTQGERGLQIEAVAATPFLFGAGGGAIYYDTEILTYQVQGAGVDAVASVLTPVMALAVAAICALGVWRVRRGSPFLAVLPPLALALVVCLIVTNKVGSPQFQTWLIAPLVAWVVWDRARAWPLAALGLVTAGLTHIVYPLAYHLVLVGDTVGLGVLAARNALVVVLGIWAVVRLARPTSSPRRLSPIAHQE